MHLFGHLHIPTRYVKIGATDSSLLGNPNLPFGLWVMCFVMHLKAFIMCVEEYFLYATDTSVINYAGGPSSAQYDVS